MQAQWQEMASLGLRWLTAGAAALIAGMSVLALIGSDQSIWIAPRLPLALWHLVVALVVVSVAVGVLVVLPSWWRRGAMVGAALLSICCLLDAIGYWRLLAGGSISSGLVLPTSLLVAVLLGIGAVLLWRPPPSPPELPRWLLWPARLGLAGGGALLIVLVQIVLFGCTDYRRPADCAIVLGAKVDARGRPSLALSDRVRTGIALYRSGLVRYLVMTGGTGANGVSEPQGMRRMAIAAGVPPEAIVLDEHGVNTRASAVNVAELMRRRGWKEGLLVSHYYHLARCRMAFRREGAMVRTVPARMTRRLAREPYFLLRECAALLVYALP
jgi:uncharacterized SAM-binding protein YcdF (DUF218 family)